MLKNIKYIRFASKFVKIIVVYHILNGLLGLALNLSGTQMVVIDNLTINNQPGLLTTGSLVINSLITIFVFYTVARALELFADIAEKVLETSKQQSEPQLAQPDQP